MRPDMFPRDILQRSHALRQAPCGVPGGLHAGALLSLAASVCASAPQAWTRLFWATWEIRAAVSVWSTAPAGRTQLPAAAYAAIPPRAQSRAGGGRMRSTLHSMTASTLDSTDSTQRQDRAAAEAPHLHEPSSTHVSTPAGNPEEDSKKIAQLLKHGAHCLADLGAAAEQSDAFAAEGIDAILQVGVR